MARTGDDSWDLASSVGATATMVAAGRAFASRDPDPLIDDPFAEPLVRAVGLEFFSRMLDGDLDMSQLPDASPERVQAMIDGMAVRTKFFDDYFHDAVGTGIRQAVILASGLDARAYRLEWAPGTVVYEVDQPRVIEFKSTTLAGLGAAPTAERRTVGIDLREDWPTALRAAASIPRRPPRGWPRVADLSATRGTGSPLRPHHRAVGARQHGGHRIRARHHRFRRRPGAGTLGPAARARPRRRHAHPGVPRTAQSRHGLPGGLGWRVDGVPRDDLFARYRRRPRSTRSTHSARSCMSAPL